jgi:glutamate formiminotransferase
MPSNKFFMNPIIECVPNFSEGRNRQTIEKIAGAFRGREGIKLLDYSADCDHNRMVVTAAGEPGAMFDAVIEAVGIAVGEIDLCSHSGQHPRIGAVDVIPFIPLRGMDLQDASVLAVTVARSIAGRYSLPVYMYEYSASAGHRQNLASVRSGGFEGLSGKMKLPEWKPDFGPATPHPTAGAVAVGARRPLIAFNVNIDSNDIEIAKFIARKIRFSSGGLPSVKALGMKIESKNLVQVSVNLTDYTITPLCRVIEAIYAEAAQAGVGTAGIELIGLIPEQALAGTAGLCQGFENFSIERALETGGIK